MGHQASTRGAQHLGSTIDAPYRHATPKMGYLGGTRPDLRLL
jgi:hypothetical protein